MVFLKLQRHAPSYQIVASTIIKANHFVHVIGRGVQTVEARGYVFPPQPFPYI